MDHLSPPGPVVSPAIPDTQRISDTLVPEYAREILVITARGVISTNGQDNVEVSQSCQSPRVVFVLDEGAGIIEIDIIVRVATGKTRNVVEATHADNAANPFRVTKGEICSMVSAEARTSGNQEGIRVPIVSER